MMMRAAGQVAPNLRGASASTEFAFAGTTLEQALDAVERHLELEELRGWDPYDTLCSPLFRLPILRSNHLLRFAAQQTLKRSPWNLRPLLRVPKQLNPVSIGLYLQAQAHRAVRDPDSLEWRRDQGRAAVERLAAAVTTGYHGSCWGYPFDWETRYGSAPAGTPTIVATGMIANGLWMATQDSGWRRPPICSSAPAISSCATCLASRPAT